MATVSRRGLPYLYASWLAAYLAGERQCLWQLWFQSRYKFDKVLRSDFSLEAWKADHDQLVTARAEVMRQDGFSVTVEHQNYWQLRGASAIGAGKMDLVARKNGYGVVLDGKTGAPKARDYWQVLIYLTMLPLCWHTRLRLSGEVFYKDGSRRQIEPEEVTEERKGAIFALIRQIGQCQEQPPRTPSIPECARCDVGRNDCPDRMEPEAENSGVEHTDLF